MRATRGFTLIEIVIVLLAVGILATAGLVGYRSQQRNARLSAAALKLAVRMQGLKYEAMSSGADHLLVFADAPGGDASECGAAGDAPCARWVILQRPDPAWKLEDFDAEDPAALAELVEEELLPRGAHLGVGTTPPPMTPPFGSVAVHDPALTVTCTGDRRCFAVRYTARGDVRAEPPGGGVVTLPGYAFVLAGDAAVMGAQEQRGVLVSFPAGMLRTFSFQEQP